MDINLLKVRMVAFIYELVALITTVVLGVLSSDVFAQLVNEHFGQTVTGSLILLITNGVVKHMRNIKVVNEFGDNRDKIII